MKIRTASRLTSLRIAGLALLVAGLAACATPFKADVSRFDAQLPAPQGETFAVVADDPALAGGLEFALYADHVEAAMEKLGYAQAAPDAATLLVRFDYGVDDGRERVRSTGYGYADPFYSPWYGSRFYGSAFYRSRFYGHHGLWSYGFYDPWFGGSDVRSYTVYTSGIDLKIDRAATGERLFEGKAQAVSTSNRLQYLVPNLVDAMFTGFPGNSGETVRISIKPEDQKVKKSDKDRSGY
ncbi:MAG: lipoprotein transmembrane [Sphingomonadales bacterium BRH_c42]|nr:MAG: lipoprotein transmembrane [Sphingomonadales bacterium BRH_c42]